MPNKPNDWEDLLNDESLIEDVKLDPDEIKKNLPDYPIEKLCEMIICDRYFGFEQQLSIMCMEELAKRRAAGNTFDFESYIEMGAKELPSLDFSMMDIRTVLNQAVGKKSNK